MQIRKGSTRPKIKECESKLPSASSRQSSSSCCEDTRLCPRDPRAPTRQPGPGRRVCSGTYRWRCRRWKCSLRSRRSPCRASSSSSSLSPSGYCGSFHPPSPPPGHLDSWEHSESDGPQSLFPQALLLLEAPTPDQARNSKVPLKDKFTYGKPNLINRQYPPECYNLH